MADWFNRLTNTWHKVFKGGFWDALVYNWDDENLPWDGIGDDAFYEDDPQTFQSSNKTAWHTKQTPNWQS